MLLLTALTTVAAGEPLRLGDGRPFVCVYYFGHWWEPWKSDDEAIRRDFQTLREMGVSVIAVDHEWSQAIDGDFRWLDREHRLAREAGLQILPWLSSKVWSDMSSDGRRALVKQQYGVDLALGEGQDGSADGVRIWDDATITAGAAYAAEYIDRYRDQALLHLDWQGRTRPVVSLTVEAEWKGGFDDASTMLFIRWLRNRYHSDIGALNAAWGTRYGGFWEVSPRNTAIFPYGRVATGKRARHERAVEDHMAFRGEMISDSLGMMATRLRRTHPDALTLIELPYQLGSRHPHAVGYRVWGGSTAECARSADILFLRSTGFPLTAEERDVLDAWRRQTGQPVILTHRTQPGDWARERTPEELRKDADLCAREAAGHADGVGFYSWNEMVDTHLAPREQTPEESANPGFAITREQSERAVTLMRATVRRYIELVGATAGR